MNRANLKDLTCLFSHTIDISPPPRQLIIRRDFQISGQAVAQFPFKAIRHVFTFQAGSQTVDRCVVRLLFARKQNGKEIYKGNARSLVFINFAHDKNRRYKEVGQQRGKPVGAKITIIVPIQRGSAR